MLRGIFYIIMCGVFIYILLQNWVVDFKTILVWSSGDSVHISRHFQQLQCDIKCMHFPSVIKSTDSFKIAMVYCLYLQLKEK